MKLPFPQLHSKIIAFTDQGLISGTSFGLGLVITRICGTEMYGTFTLYWMVFLFLQGISIAYIGLPMQVVSQEQPNPKKYLENNLQLSNILLLFIGLCLYIGFSIYDSFIETSPKNLGFWGFPILICLALKQDIHRKYFYTLQQNKNNLWIDLIGYGLQIPLLLIFSSLYKLQLIHIVWALGIPLALSQCLFYLLKPKNTCSFFFENLPFKKNWNYGKYLISTNILQWFSGNFLIITAATTLGNNAVGIIRIFQNFMGVLHVLFLTMDNIIPPKAANLLHTKGTQSLIQYFKKVTLSTGGIYLLILAAIGLFGQKLLIILYGEAYGSNGYLLNYFIIIYVFVFLGTIAQILIKTLQLNQGIFIAYILTVIATAIMANPLIDNFGILGVIYGLGILQCICLITYITTLKTARL